MCKEIELHIRIGKKIQSLNFAKGNEMFLMLQDLMYFDTVPEEYKTIIKNVFEVEYPIDEEV